MNHRIPFLPATLALLLLAACILFSAGCVSSPAQAGEKTIPAAAATATTTAAIAESPAVPATTAAAATTPASVPLTTATLTDGVSITYPADWQKEELSELGQRDYGRTTLNIANFYSPDISAERQEHDATNPDTAAYTTLSIDVDPEPVTDFEHYFNLVTLALQKTYGHIEITKHNYQLNISQTDTHPGYKSYQMDFDTKNLRGSYIFTNVDGTIYIFAFRNPSPYSSEVHEMYDSIVIAPVTDTGKHR